MNIIMALTNQDFIRIENIIDHKLDEKLDKKFDKVNNTLAMVMGELATIRDEVTLSASRASVEEIEDRVVVLEKLHPNGKHRQTSAN
mgnify:FL=1